MNKLKYLRIKKKFLEQILNGEKVFEFRNLTPYFLKFFEIEERENKIEFQTKYLILHYQTTFKVLVNIESIEFSPLAENFPNGSKFLTTKNILKIKLKDPLIVPK